MRARGEVSRGHKGVQFIPSVLHLDGRATTRVTWVGIADDNRDALEALLVPLRRNKARISVGDVACDPSYMLTRLGKPVEPYGCEIYDGMFIDEQRRNV
jgi:hypothetical protein